MMNQQTRYTRFFQISLLLCVCFSVSSCFDDKDIEEVITSRPDPQEIVTATIYGRVLDHLGSVQSNATVKLLTATGPQTLQTDEQGYFLFVDEEVSKSAYLQAFSDPGVVARKKTYIIENKVNYVEIYLPLSRNIQPFSAAVTNSIGAFPTSITIKANSLVTPDGLPYSGMVNGNTSQALPDQEIFHQTVISDLSGIDDIGKTVSLKSFGMIEANLFADDGRELELVNGAEAEIRTINIEEFGDVPLWQLDEETGTWLESGSSTWQTFSDVGGFVGSISNLGIWNFDVKVDPINISGQIHTTFNGAVNSGILGHSQVFIASEEFGKRGGFAASNGEFNFLNFPKNEVFTLTVLDDCKNTVFEKEFGPFSSDQILEDIEIDVNRDQVVVSGKVEDCMDQSVKEGLLIVETESNEVFVNQFENGEFSIAFDKECIVGEELLITFLNKETEERTMPFAVRINDGDVNIGEIILCPQTETYLRYKLENQVSVTCTDLMPVNFNPTPITDNFGCGEFNISMLELDGEGVYNSDIFFGLIFESVFFDHNEPEDFTIHIHQFGDNTGDAISGTIIGQVRPLIGGGVYGPPVRISGSFILKAP